MGTLERIAARNAARDRRPRERRREKPTSIMPRRVRLHQLIVFGWSAELRRQLSGPGLAAGRDCAGASGGATPAGRCNGRCRRSARIRRPAAARQAYRRPRREVGSAPGRRRFRRPAASRGLRTSSAGAASARSADADIRLPSPRHRADRQARRAASPPSPDVTICSPVCSTTPGRDMVRAPARSVLSPDRIAWMWPGSTDHRNAAGQIGQQDDPAGVLAHEIDAPDHAALVHHRFARLDALVLAGIQDHVSRNGRLARPMTCAVTGRQRRILHGVEQQLITLQPLFEDERRVLPLAELRVLFLELLVLANRRRRSGPFRRPSGRSN